MKVQVIYKSGKSRVMDKRYADILIKMGKVQVLETEESSEDVETEISDRTGKPKRRYRRRDMQAE